MKTITLAGHLTIDDLINVARFNYTVKLSQVLKRKISLTAALLDKLLKKPIKIYGINTGLGALLNTKVSLKESQKLQQNIIRSHACGVGTPFPSEIVRAILLMQINKIAQGYSGVRLSTIEALTGLLNGNILPLVYQQGSVGSSGDLTPLAHIGLVLLGEGEAVFKNKTIPGRQALSLIKQKPINLKPREGLALINGTEVQTAIAAINVYDAETIMTTADISAALSMIALRCQHSAFDERIHQLKPHPGQLAVADNLRKLLAKEKASNLQGQAAYSLRCLPQVHGASRDAIAYVKERIETEVNSVTDNPLIFADTQQVLSGGNFHGQSVGIPMDVLAIALSEFANICERRVERMVNKDLNNGLPPFLARNPGLNSGLMILQYASAALVSENKILAHPASVDSIPTSANQEDHVSMSTIAARKCRQIVDHVEQVLAIELITACQAVDLLKDKRLPAPLKRVYQLIRRHVPMVEADIAFYRYVKSVKQLVSNRAIIDSLGIKLL